MIIFQAGEGLGKILEVSQLLRYKFKPLDQPSSIRSPPKFWFDFVESLDRGTILMNGC